MGLSVTATHVIWFFAVVGLLGGALGAFFDLQARFDEAQEARRAIDGERLHTRLQDATFCYDNAAHEVRVNATNTGHATLDTSNLSFVVDGTVRSSVTRTSMDGGTTDLWPPGEWSNFTVASVASEPSSLVLATQRGIVVRPVKTTCPTLTTIVVTPSGAGVRAGTTQDYAAQGYDQFGSPYSVSSFSWSTNAGTIASLTTTTARLTASTLAATGKTVTATFGSVSGSASVDVYADVPASVTVAPSLVGVPAGGSQAFTATVRDQYNNVNATASVSWAASAGSISTGGVLTAPTVPQNGVTVTATSGSASGQATVNVYAAAPASITVTPSSATVNTQASQSFSATAYDAYGNVNSTATITWSATRGSITSGGAYTAPSTTGADTVRATSGAAQGTASVSVIRTVHVTLFQTYLAGAATTTFTRGDVIETRVTVVDHLGNAVSGATVNINLTNPSAAVVCCTSVTTNAGGMAFFNYTIPNPSSNRGSWTDALTVLSGTDLVRNQAADVSTSKTLTVN